jgi:hypothetical protein
MMARWVALREICYVDATVSEGSLLEGVSPEVFSSQEREAFKRRKARLAKDRPDLTIVPIRFEGRVRWVNAPEDVRLHLAPRGGILSRRRKP